MAHLHIGQMTRVQVPGSHTVTEETWLANFLTSTSELWPARMAHIHTHTHENILKE